MTSNKLFDFSQPHPEYENIWGALDDVVMGGVSSSNLQLVGDCALFSGVVSTDNAGGFVSVRTRNFDPPLDLSSYRGIKLVVQGDSNRYKFLLRDSTGWDSIAYSYEFDPPSDWGEVFMPFGEFIPVFRARTVPTASPLQLAHIYSLQLMLSKFSVDGRLNPKFQAGRFQLAIREISVV